MTVLIPSSSHQNIFSPRSQKPYLPIVTPRHCRPHRHLQQLRRRRWLRLPPRRVGRRRRRRGGARGHAERQRRGGGWDAAHRAHARCGGGGQRSSVAISAAAAIDQARFAMLQDAGADTSRPCLPARLGTGGVLAPAASTVTCRSS